MQSSAGNDHGKESHTPGSATESDSGPLGIPRYLAADFGGFTVGFAELLRAGNDTTNVTVLRIAAVFREQFTPLLGTGWIALLALALFSAVLCSIYRPGTRKESFSLGLSIFALLTALTPQEKEHQPADAPAPLAFLFFVPAAHAQPFQKGQTGDFYFEFTNLRPGFGDKSGLISVFDTSGRYLLIKLPIDIRQVAKVSLPKGDYGVQFECNGCARVRADLLIEKREEASRIRLGSSNVPLSLQRLFSPDVVEISDVPEYELAKIKQRYAAQDR